MRSIDNGGTNMNFLQEILDTSVNNKHLFGISVSVIGNETRWSGVAGNLKSSGSYFIASTTKLFTSALIFRLRERGKLAFEDKISKYLSESALQGLHVYQGKDYSNQISIANLLAHTSGLPDYFKNKSRGKQTLEGRLTQGNDVAWDFQQVLQWTKHMVPKFAPSSPGKAHYSDTNYQILGKIIEDLYESALADVIQQEICVPLALADTYLYVDHADRKPKQLYFKSEELHIPKAMSSFAADGGMVSTSQDLIHFVQGFMKGKLFPEQYIRDIQKWNKIFFPLESGMGIHRFKPPWYFSPFRKVPEMIGHSGLSGAFAFFVPKMNTFLAGTVNQIHQPGHSYRLMMKVLVALQKGSGS